MLDLAKGLKIMLYYILVSFHYVMLQNKQPPKSQGLTTTKVYYSLMARVGYRSVSGSSFQDVDGRSSLYVRHAGSWLNHRSLLKLLLWCGAYITPAYFP